MRSGHQWFKLSNMDKTQSTSSNDHSPENSTLASPPPPPVVQPLAEPPVTTTVEEASNDDDDEYLGPKALYTLISALMLVIIVLTLDQSILATAIPYITDDFHTIADIGWYGAAYLLSTASLQVSGLIRVLKHHMLTVPR